MCHMPAATSLPSVTRADVHLAGLALRFMDQIKVAIREVGDEVGLSLAQLDVLRQLYAHGPTPMRRLAEIMYCEASNLTGLVDKLEARGLVERQADPADRRVRLLALTEEGTHVSQQMWVAMASRCPFMKLSPEQRALLEVLLRETVLPG